MVNFEGRRGRLGFRGWGRGKLTSENSHGSDRERGAAAGGPARADGVAAAGDRAAARRDPGRRLERGAREPRRALPELTPSR